MSHKVSYMPTQKRRLNISLTKEVETILKKISLRDNMPQATKAFNLLISALEIEEDEIWNSLASARDTAKAKFIGHANAWL